MLPYYFSVGEGVHAELDGWTCSWINPHDSRRKHRYVSFLTKEKADKCAEVKRRLRMESVMVKPATHPIRRGIKDDDHAT